MEYNTQRNKLVIPEYGRNIQKMIEHLLSVDDRKKRTAMANTVVSIMAQLHPGIKDTNGDMKHKLWDHLYIISDFNLDIDAPYPPPSIEKLNASPEKIPYNTNHIPYRHYGKNIIKMIDKAIEYEESPEKDAIVTAIANHIKKSYLNWNRESVDNDLIISHLEELSNGKLKLSEEAKLNNTSDILSRTKKKKHKKENTNYRQRKDKRNNS